MINNFVFSKQVFTRYIVSLIIQKWDRQIEKKAISVNKLSNPTSFPVREKILVKHKTTAIKVPYGT
jgi:hypothetical protein